MNEPLQVSTPQLKRILNLRRSTSLSGVMPLGHTVFYIRCYAFQRQQFLTLVNSTYAFGHDISLDSNAYRIYQAVAGLDENHEAPVLLRYAGMTTGGSGWKRHEDHLEGSKSALVSILVQKCKEIYPEIIEAAEVYELPDAELTFPLDTYRQRIADVREQALIALLGPGSLLNSDSGGHAAPYTVHPQDAQQFTAFGTSLLKELHWHTSDSQVTAAIKQYALHCQQYAIDHPSTTGHERSPIDDAMTQVIADQAVARTTSSKAYAMLVTIGTDLTDDAVERKKWFYDGIGRASSILMDIIDGLAFCELGYSTTSIRPSPSLRNEHQLPFVDLYPRTVKHNDDYEPTISMLRDYLQITKPFVALTLGHLTSSTAVGRFQHKNGLRPRDFYDYVGTVHLSGYDDKPEQTSADNCCLVIPCLHPGMVRYCTGDVRELLLRIISKTVAVAWLTTSRVMAAVKDTKLSKRQICRQVQLEVGDLTGPSTAFGASFSKLRATYLEKRGSSLALKRKGSIVDDDWAPAMKDQTATGTRMATQGLPAKAPSSPKFKASNQTRLDVNDANLAATLLTASARWSASVSELSLLINCDMARGSPESLIRKNQILRLTSLSLAPFKRLSKSQLRNSIEATPQGQLFYFAINDKPDLYLPDMSSLLSLFLDDSIHPDKDNWTVVIPAVESACTRLVEWVEKHFFQHADRPLEETYKTVPGIMQKFFRALDRPLADKMRTLQRDISDPSVYFESNGQQVKIRARAWALHRDQLLLKWKNQDGEYELEKFDLPNGCLPHVAGEVRTLHMRTEGLDICDPDGRSLGTNSYRRVTLPLSNLLATLEGNPLKDKFLELWERHTGLNWEEALWAMTESSTTQADAVEVIPASFFSGSRQLALTQVSHREYGKKSMAELLPFQSGDAGWLIDRFLKDKYPDGGTVYLYNADDPELVVLFVDNACPSMFVDLLA